ncbi:MAG: ATP-binding protein [Desulfatiglans sp.]|nr:PAS domain S-box protein [Thermodesulfobacteriota bacterium]MEE4354806.1 ATP-binding protein [Desulfatiglans sp.]
MTESLFNSPFDDRPDKWTDSFEGKRTDIPINIAFIGGGKACYNLLLILEKNRSSRVNVNVLGVADTNPEAPGLIYAKKLGLFATTDFRDLYKLEGLNLLLELTGSEKARKEIIKTKPAHISMMDHIGGRFLWDLVQMEMEKTTLEREHQIEQQKEKKHTQVILDSLPYRVMVINMDMTVDNVNQTFLSEFDLTDKDVIGEKCHKVRYNLNRPCAECGKTCYLNEVGKEKKSISTIQEWRNDNSGERFEVVTVSPILDEDNEMVQFIEASRDVTERISLEREAQKTKVFLEDVIQSTVDGIVVVDNKGYVLIFNEGMERLTGYDAREVNHLTSFYDIDVARENMRKMRSQEYGPLGKLNPTSMSVTTKDGREIPVTLSASLVTVNNEVIGSVGVFTDMREIVQMRKELEDAHLQLVQTEKIASVGRMAAGVAHEINNPLSGVLIYAELLKESLDDRSPLQKDIQEIVDQTLRCKKIVSELLEFSRQSIGKTSSFSVETLINDCLNLLINQAIFQDIEVNTRLEEEMPQMLGDRGQLQQVFTNLFINAAHAMEGKGALGIDARYDKARECFVIKVSDSGPGISEDLRDKIFDIFFTTKPVGEGTGLGLSISQNIISLHGGNLRFECPKEGGTAFIVELPIGLSETVVDERLFIGLDE